MSVGGRAAASRGPDSTLGAVAASGEPDPFADSFTAAITARALTAAVELGLFEALAEH